MLAQTTIVEIIKYVFDDDQFEELCGAFLIDRGYREIRRGKIEGPDGGFDWEAWTDKGGTPLPGWCTLQHCCEEC